MGNSKFFTNRNTSNSLFEKIKGIINGMVNLQNFNAVVGYFRSSGYFKIRNEIQKSGKLPTIKILIGINIDNIFRQHNKSMLFLAGEKEKKEATKQYRQDFIDDVKNAGYSEDIEKGILLLADDLLSGQVELKIHPTKSLHAKFYLFLPEKFNENSDGWVIMGSSNISDSGLGITQPPHYELNVAMKDYDDVAFCENEFEELWKEGVPITFDDIEDFKGQTYLGQNPTPFEIYMKLLIEYFGDQVEDDFNLDMPKEFKELMYQKDAACQGYQMLTKYNGFFLADVVGLGKTVVAAMIAKRFVEENGIHKTRILVIYPPALAANWKETFEKFKIKRNTDFITCGSLDKILEGENNYRPAEEYDLILVDEAHRFRADNSQMYDALQRICKTEREDVGRAGDSHKKVMLISATPLNNRPTDLYNLISLFQDRRKSTIDGIPNLQNYFSPLIARYKSLTSSKQKCVDVKGIQDVYKDIRINVINKITVRRTRQNILNYPEYKKDIDSQKIRFPDIESPREVKYILPNDLKDLFTNTVSVLNKQLNYARYKAIDALNENIKNEKYPNAAATSRSLANIYRTHMIKRLESSFYALRISLRNLRRATQGMIDMYHADKVIIAPDLKVIELQDKGFELDDIIAKGIEKFGISKNDFVYKHNDFNDSFIKELESDVSVLDTLIKQWDKITIDPKLDRFIEYLNHKIFDKRDNPTGKLVIFSESKDTILYLKKELTRQLGRTDILSVSSDDRKQLFNTIQANFDANYQGKKQDKYNIIMATDVLAEGINLHRANVIVNYDTPWNATRLMQRIGRVNRIGSVAGKIINYEFYPSDEGNKQIRLYDNALAKLQGFHSALGEDSQIYSHEEVVEQFKLFDTNVKDEVDHNLELLRKVREFRSTNPDDYERIKKLPIKSRTGRSVLASGKDIRPSSSLVYIASPYKKEFYKVTDDHVEDIGFLNVIDLFEAKPDEKSIPLPKCHYRQIDLANKKFEADVVNMNDDNIKFTPTGKDNIAEKAKSLLRDIWRKNNNSKIRENCDILDKYVKLGTYTKLTRDLSNLERVHRKGKITDDDIVTAINSFVAKYHTVKKIIKKEKDDTPYIILSETFE